MEKYSTTLDLTNNLVNLSSSILKRFGVTPFHETMKDVDELLLKNKDKKVVLFLFDAFGKNIIEKYKGFIPFIYSHIYKEFSSIYPPTTVAATNALITGKYPKENGFVGWNQYFKDEDKFIDVFLNRDKVSNTIIDKDLTSTYLKPAFIFDLINNKNKKEIATQIKDIDFKDEEDDYKRLDLFFNKLNEKINTHEFIYAYSSLPDHTMHQEGINGAHVLNDILELSYRLEKFVSSHQDVLVLLCADHGFIDIKNINILEDKELMSTLETKNVGFSIEGRFASLLVKNDKINEFKEIYNKKYKNKFLLISKEELLSQNILGVGENFKDLDSILGNYFFLSCSKYNLSEENCSTLVGAHAGITKKELELYLMVFNSK